jgi:phosphocarrier,  HPr family
MAQVTATIASKVGLHARPAATFVKAVAEKGVPVTIAKEGGAPVDASSILGVMTLGAGFGDVVTLASDADGADSALSELKELLETDLDA